MGLTIHYKGQLRDTSLIPDFVKELEDIANSLDWKSTRIDRLIPLDEESPIPEERVQEGIRLIGIHVTPPDCETFCFDFAPSGRMMNIIMLRFSPETYPEADFVYLMHTKTQYAGMELHIAAIALMRYLEKKYFQSLEVSDEGNYWETNDVAILTQRFEEYTTLINAVKEALQKAVLPPNLEENDLIQQVMKIIRDGLDELDH
jgi:hypothetical protein